MTHDLFLINLDRQGEAEAVKELGNLLITDTCEADGTAFREEGRRCLVGHGPRPLTQRVC